MNLIVASLLTSTSLFAAGSAPSDLSFLLLPTRNVPTTLEVRFEISSAGKLSDLKPYRFGTAKRQTPRP